MRILHNILEADIHLLKLNGPLSGPVAEEIKQTIKGIYDQGAKHIIVNLEEVPFIDSRGLAVLAVALKSPGYDGRTFCLVAPQPQPKLVFELTGFDRIFQIFDNVAEAVAQPSPNMV